MEALRYFWEGQTSFLALAVLLLFVMGFARRGVQWYLTKWLGVSECTSSRISAIANVGIWTLILLLLSLFRGLP